MALHGPIRVGDLTIGYWSARRTVALEDREQISTYECEVVSHDDTHAFEVEHRYSDGALALMAKVIAWAAGEDLTGKPVADA